MRRICRWHDRGFVRSDARESHMLGRVCPPGTSAITRNKRQRFFVGFHRRGRWLKERDTAREVASLVPFRGSPRVSADASRVSASGFPAREIPHTIETPTIARSQPRNWLHGVFLRPVRVRPKIAHQPPALEKDLSP